MNINIEYLKQIRRDAGLSQTELGEKMGVSRDTIARLEKGAQKITLDNLISYSSYCGVPIPDIFNGIKDASQFVYMLRSDRGEQLTPEIKRLFEDWYNRYLDILDRMELKIASDIPDIQKDLKSHPEIRQNGEKTADWLRKKLDMGNIPVMDPVNFLEDQGLLVGGVSLEDVKLNAIVGRKKNTDTFGIIVNTSKEIPIERQRFSLMHELGHLIAQTEHFQNSLSHSGRGRNKSDAEKFADEFASAFLVPGNALRNRIANFQQNYNGKKILNYLKHHFKVSYMVILYRLKDIGYINEDNFKKLLGSIKKIYGLTEPYPLNEPLQFHREHDLAVDILEVPSAL